MSTTRQRTIPSKRSHLPENGLAYTLLAAAQLVTGVMQGSSLTDLFEQQASEHRWPAKVRAAVRDLTWVCLRDYGRGDAILAHYLHKPVPITVHAVLLVAVSRLLHKPERAHVLVSQTVDAVNVLNPRLAGVVNAVLRSVIREPEVIDTCLTQDLVSTHAHPEWWIAELRTCHPAVWQSILAAGNRKPPMAVRINRRRTDPASFSQILLDAGISHHEFDNGALILEQPVSVDRLPGFHQGWVSVQDAGAQWAARWLDPQSGDRVLDACAAPGGKSAHLLECADLDLVALELDPARVTRIQTNLQRLGLQATVIQGNASQPAQWWDGKPFDRILADVPCSASGVVRRHPDIKWHRRVTDIAAFARQQAEIIEALWPLLAPGGRMLYVTCSLFEQENGAQIHRFCAHHRDARRVLINDEPQMVLLPNDDHDGFFYALLEKQH